MGAKNHDSQHKRDPTPWGKKKMNPEDLEKPSSSIQKLHRRHISPGVEGPGRGIQQASA